MNSTPTPFNSTRVFIEEQLLAITTKLKSIDPSKRDNLFAIYKDAKRTFYSIEKHQAALRSIVFSALVEYEPSVVYAFSDNHLPHEVLGLKILEIAETLLHSESAAETATGIAALIHHFNKYSTALYENIYREEATLLPLLKRYYSEEALAAMQIQGADKLHCHYPSNQLAEQVL